MAIAWRDTEFFARQRGYLPLWVPVCFGLGIGAYFFLPYEPSKIVLAVMWALIICLSGLCFWGLWRWPLVVAILISAAGFGWVAVRAQLVAAPTLTYRYYGPVTGRVISIDRARAGAARVTLDQVILSNHAPKTTPRRVRISLRDPPDHVHSRLGQTVMTTAHLMPPSGPVEPYGFDFRRHAWFEKLGAVGYTNNPLMLWRDKQPRALWLTQIRASLTTAIRMRLPGDTGAVAAAIITGDRTAISAAILRDLRQSNLAHLLAISGLHMGLLTGLTMAAIRLILATLPMTALDWRVKQHAALGGILAGAIYLALSGGNVATQRAFIMATVILGAILINRRAITLRAVAVAAALVLMHRPQSIVTPGFQMSFAATTALVATFSLLREKLREISYKWLRAGISLFVSSLVAGLATAPFSAAHFNTISHFGLFANLLAVPLMGTIVMPSAILTAVLALFGAGQIGLTVMGWGIDLILKIAAFVAAWPNAVGAVASPPPIVLPMISLGALWVILWHGMYRHLGWLVCASALALWTMPRPALLIASDANLVGVMTSEGRGLTKIRSSGFVARIWLENDGDLADQAVAFERLEKQIIPAGVSFNFQNQRVAHLSGTKAAAAFTNACARHDIVVISQAIDNGVHNCRVIDIDVLRQRGALALNNDGRTIGAKDVIGGHIWNRAREH